MKKIYLKSNQILKLFKKYTKFQTVYQNKFLSFPSQWEIFASSCLQKYVFLIISCISVRVSWARILFKCWPLLMAWALKTDRVREWYDFYVQPLNDLDEEMPAPPSLSRPSAEWLLHHCLLQRKKMQSFLEIWKTDYSHSKT